MPYYGETAFGAQGFSDRFRAAEETGPYYSGGYYGTVPISAMQRMTRGPQIPPQVGSPLAAYYAPVDDMTSSSVYGGPTSKADAVIKWRRRQLESAYGPMDDETARKIQEYQDGIEASKRRLEQMRVEDEAYKSKLRELEVR